MKKYSWALLAALMTTQVVAQNEQQEEEEMDAIATDRPDITESAFITPVGWLQYEGGYQFSSFTSINFWSTEENTHQFEQVFRVGLYDNFELRAVVNANTIGLDDLLVGPSRETGINPITVGFKYNLMKESPNAPQMTWLSQISLPGLAFGDHRNPFQSNFVFHEQRLMVEKSISSRVGLAANFGVSGGLVGEDGFISAGMYSVAVGLDLGNNWGMYIEQFSNFTGQGNQVDTRFLVDGGITKLLSNDLQLDVYAGIDLTDRINLWPGYRGFIMGGGLSYRLPVFKTLP